MNNKNHKLITVSGLLLSFVIASAASAHTVGGPIDINNNNASATDYGFVSCYDDGHGPADALLVQIEDASSPVPGLLVSLQVSKGSQMINVTDPVSGDGKGSALVKLKGGNGDYKISVNKTAAGVRDFSITYHCETSGDEHTGTDIGVYQIQ